jgi:hypothetical protein
LLSLPAPSGLEALPRSAGRSSQQLAVGDRGRKRARRNRSATLSARQPRSVLVSPPPSIRPTATALLPPLLFCLCFASSSLVSRLVSARPSRRRTDQRRAAESSVSSRADVECGAMQQQRQAATRDELKERHKLERILSDSESLTPVGAPHTPSSSAQPLLRWLICRDHPAPKAPCAAKLTLHTHR